MSLNGLDNPDVLEAYQSALTEAGGWFLLHYTSRDEVALLSRGTGGVPDVRNAIDGYEEASPLYGFVQYRRRKVVLSYLPEDLSRLVKARTTVQFQSVLDKFSPHDTVFSLSKSTDLSESALSSACLLHAASGSITSSSSSLRRHRLMEITEDAEENTPDKDDSQAQSPVSETPQRPFSQRSDATVTASQRAPSRLHQTTSASDQLEPETNASDVSSTIDNFPAPPSVTFDHSSERASLHRNFRDDLANAPSDSRRFSQSSRPSMRDLDHISPYTTPKVKRGPRPSVESSSRPRSQDKRPVASLPAGVRSSALRRPSPNTTPLRPRSQGNPVASPMSGKGATPGVPPLLVPPLSMPISRPHISPGAKSLSAVSTSGLSPEKERLMKALQQRKKQMEKRSGQSKQKQPPAETDENKENVGYGQLNHDKGAAAVDNFKTRSDQSTEPCNEATSFISPVQSKPDSAVDMVVSDSDGDQHSSTITTPLTTPTTAATTTTIDKEQTNNNHNTDDYADDHHGEEEKQPTADDFPLPVSSSSGIIDSKPEDGPRSPSAVDGPLENKSGNTPENEIVVSPPPTNPPPNSSEQEADTAPETLPRPNTSTTIPNASSNSIAPIDCDSQHDQPTPESSDPVRQHVTERREKRKPYLEPIQVPTPEYSDEDNLLSDDSFMEELKSATVQEAKPVSVGSPVIADNGDEQPASSPSPETQVNTRAVSNPTAAVESQSANLQAIAGGRSVSSTYLETAAGPKSPALVARKVNVSSGISSRIKALEKFTGNRDVPATATPPNMAGSHAAQSFETFRKRASISQPPGSFNSPAISRSASTSRPASQAANLTRDDSQSSLNGTQTTSSVSVTARIVRDTDGASLDNQLQASPLTVEHETSEVPVSPNLTAESATDDRERRSMSTSSAGSGAPTIQRSESRMSVSSKGEGEDKKASRTSRLLNRMSSITSNSRKSLLGALSPSGSLKGEEGITTPEKSPEPESAPALAKAPAPAPEVQAIDIGEVNVQFPDTLLWKRRFVRIDDKGYLVLTPANVDSTGRNMTKKYHLTEFRTPCLPDEDCQELPNSIVLDFLDGSTLQCACESRQGQAFVLQTLVQAHGSYQSV
ncbi:hypothetical protein SI65_06813 [Aspergillus cristatus]|uniref:ADF-H domain-containing protein n=1 Tax=Aspergillus cristatus TaxID=573508 RepID=A0A1E3BAN8_ASPCR|nr:hypothetical protein SI65_06813 [Aspergillus cristatus]